MSRIVIALFSVVLFVATGCQQDNNRGTMSTSADACPSCPGVQSVTMDGKCSGCGAKISASTSGDACPMCPGVQKATADGMCPGCKMKV
jgi:hypothetical protein